MLLPVKLRADGLPVPDAVAPLPPQLMLRSPGSAPLPLRFLTFCPHPYCFTRREALGHAYLSACGAQQVHGC